MLSLNAPLCGVKFSQSDAEKRHTQTMIFTQVSNESGLIRKNIISMYRAELLQLFEELECMGHAVCSILQTSKHQCGCIRHAI